MKLLSVNVGLPKEVEWRGRRVFTGIWKQPVTGARTVRRLNVDGDGQGDLGGHGGENRAAFVYQRSAYDFWSQRLARTDLTMGQFGENFTVEGMPDDEVRIGDRFRIGGALFEVTQPRVTCYRVGIRMNDPQMPARLVAEGRPGFYLRVLQEGDVAAGDSIALEHRDMTSPTVAEVDGLLYRPGPDRDRIRQALRVPALSPGWRMSLQAILDQPPSVTGNPGLAPADLSPAGQAGFRPARIAALSHITSDIVSVTLESADGRPLDAAKPGQFLVLRVPAASNFPEIIRSYSLCGGRSTDRYELGVKCEPNGLMGGYLSERAQVGQPLDISAPRGVFVLRESERAAVFLSAGIGITPLLAMLKALAAERSARRVWWLYGARSGVEHPFVAEVRTLLRALPEAQYHFRYSRPADTDRLGQDYDSIGHLDAALVARLDINPDSDFYLCGPAAFLTEMKASLIAAGAPANQVFSEVFGSGPTLNPGIMGAEQRAPHQPVGPAGRGPTVSFARTGLNVRWGTPYASLLELAEACDVPTRWSCRTGVCHTCESGLISGDVDYDPVPLQPAGNGRVLLCCSAPKSDIVVDL